MRSRCGPPDTASAAGDDVNIRRPEVKGTRRFATVHWFKDEKGYGRLTGDDGEVLVVYSLVSLAWDTGHRKTVSTCQSSGNGGIQDHSRRRADDVRLQQ
jgi:cold shock CspA family protein